MDTQEDVIKYIKEEKYQKAKEAFMQNPIFDYCSKSPLIKYESFEFSNTKKKNPIFLRVLLNYISLINLISDEKLFPINEILIKFCAKFTYQQKSKEDIKLILMAKSSTEINKIYFEKRKEIFKKCTYKNCITNHYFRFNINIGIFIIRKFKH